MEYEKSCRNKKTGEVATICSISTGGGPYGSIKIAGKDGKGVSIDTIKFFKEYECIDVDINPILPNLKSYLDVCPQAKRMLFSILRRLHPGGYFKVGELVYIVYDGAPIIFGACIDKFEFMNYIGPECPFIITEISEAYIIIHKYLPGTPLESYRNLPGEIRIQISERLEAEDAYVCLARYDVAY